MQIRSYATEYRSRSGGGEFRGFFALLMCSHLNVGCCPASCGVSRF
jgi:hypothetical protein